MWKDFSTDSDVFSDFFWDNNTSKKEPIKEENKIVVENIDSIEPSISTEIGSIPVDNFFDEPVKEEPKKEEEVIVSIENTDSILTETDNSTEGFWDLFSPDVTEVSSKTVMPVDEKSSWNSVVDTSDLDDLSWLGIEKDTSKIDIPKKEEPKEEQDDDGDGFWDLFSPKANDIQEQKVDKKIIEQKTEVIKEEPKKQESSDNWFANMFWSKKSIPVEKIIETNNEPMNNVEQKVETFDKKKKAIIWIVVLVLLVIGWAYSYFWKNSGSLWTETSTWSVSTWTKTDIVDVNSKISDDDAIKKVLEEYKSKWLAEDLKKTNLEIKDIKVLDDFNGYKENNLKFILVQYQPILTDEAITSFLVDINKATQEQVKQIKDSWKFEQVKVLMTQYYEKQYWELLKLGTLWALYKKWEWDYVIMKMGDYFKEKFYNSGVYDMKTKTMMDFIASYISYDKNYFGKDKDKVLQLSNVVMGQLKNEEWKKFLQSVNTYFFTK